MSVYVDQLRPVATSRAWKWGMAAHLLADSLDELHDFARRIGLRRQWFQPKSFPHYDLNERLMVLTKRPCRAVEFYGWAQWVRMRPNVQLGVSVSDQETWDLDVPVLLDCDAAVRWVSLEPMLGPVTMPREHLRELDWLVVGGESGPGARSCDPAWIRFVIQQCRDNGVPVFVKQMGAKPAGLVLQDRKGETMEEWPADLRVRQYPQPPWTE